MSTECQRHPEDPFLGFFKFNISVVQQAPCYSCIVQVEKLSRNIDVLYVRQYVN